MKKLISIFLIAQLIKLSLTIVPIWSFKNSAIEFMGSQSTYEQIMIEKELSDGIYVKFYKKFSRAQNIMKQNFLQFYKRYSNIILEKFVQYEDIDFVHMYNSTIFFICPKGRFHLLYINNGTINTMIPEPFNSLKEWELKCYYQPEFNQIFVAYLNHEDNNAKSIYQFNIETSQFTTSFYKMGIGLYDFKWTQTKDKKGAYPMFAFYKYTNAIYLRLFDFRISQDSFEVDEVLWSSVFSGLKSKYNLYFNSENGNFYFINYNNIYDFETGYSEEYTQINETNYQNVKATVNKASPFEFVDDVVIEEVKFITYTKYAYYKLLNKNKNIYYHGIIDVTLNKIIFNTDEDIKQFIPFSKNSMLAMTEKRAYKICSIYNNVNCMDSCISGTTLVLDIDRNICKASNTCSNYILKPDNICTRSCDLNIFTNNSNNECGLCKDIDEDNPYKIINSSNCSNSQPIGTEYYNENLKLLICANGYILQNDSCVSKNCYQNCEDCLEASTDETNQKCLLCKEGFFLLESNCIEQCPEKYFSSDKKCFKCNEECQTCDRNADDCTSCYKGYYINNGNCIKCHKNCVSCSDGEINGNENCLSCNNNTYLIDAPGLNKNCVDSCPENTVLDESKTRCVEHKPNTSGNNKNNLNSALLILAIVLLSIIVIGIIVYCIRRSLKRKKAEILIMDDIKKDMPIVA